MKLTVSNLSSEEIEMFVEWIKNFTLSPNTDLSRQCEAASTPFLMSTLYKCGQITWHTSSHFNYVQLNFLPELFVHTCILGSRICSYTRGWGVGSLLGREGSGHKEHWSGTRPRPSHFPAPWQGTWPWSPTTLGTSWLSDQTTLSSRAWIISKIFNKDPGWSKFWLDLEWTYYTQRPEPCFL